ncbi:hypothetical protein [Vineibacter terrae]|uniref:hypothetical protein n=1 Tax=Vineibacter terrae TaxID=2586908 RepID=UPI002E36171D|nr:hypothetical protein [Vineibacter terrae]HEX2889777.1 hypothetical protein [Vineibacter terrae]
MGDLRFGWGNNSKLNSNASQYEMRMSWEVTTASAAFHRLFNQSLLGFVGRVVKVFSPPQSIGLLFEFGPGERDRFARLVDNRAFPPKTLSEALREKFVPSIMIPDNPGPGHRDAWWRKLAAGAAIGASFREQGTDTSVHIAFNSTLCDVHVDRSGFAVTKDGYPHWDLNNVLRHLTLDLAGDKLPWVLGSVAYLGRNNRPIFQATLHPWLAVDLPSRDNDRTAVKIGLMVTGNF